MDIVRILCIAHGHCKTESEMTATFGIDFIQPDDQARIIEAIQDIMNNGSKVICEYQVELCGECGIRWHLMTGRRIMIDGSPFLVGVVIDITDQKLAEEALLKSEERFKTLFNSQSAIQVLLDPYTGKVLDVNQKAVEWYGWSAEELRKMYTRDINTLSQEEIIKSLQTVEARQHNKFIGRHRRADGSIRDVEIYRNKIELDGKPVIHVITQDISERKHAEAERQRLTRALIVSDHCNKALIHAQDEQELLQTICRIIVETGGYRMAWVGYKVNDEAKSLHPAAYAGSTGDYFNSITLSWADNKYGEGPAGTAVRTAQPVVVNNIITDQSFELWRTEAIKHNYAAVLGLPLLIDNTVVGVLSVYSEVPEAFNGAERKQLISLSNNLAYGIKMLRSREALKQSEERFRNLFERNAAIKLLLDPVTGNIVDANQSAADFYGWTIEELRQMNIAQMNSITPPDIIKSNLEEVRSAGHAKFSLRHIRKDGSLRDVEIFGTQINDGKKDLVNTIINDVTDRKRYEQLNAFRLRILQMADAHTIDELLRATLDEAERLTGSSIGFIFFVDEDQNTLILQSVSTNTFQYMSKAEEQSQHYPLNKAGVWADAVRVKQAVIHNDYISLKHRIGRPVGHAEIKRELVIPVNRDGKTVAIMGVCNKQTDYGDKDIQWLEIIANHVWDIIAKKIAEEEKNKLAVQLQHASKMEMIGQLAAGIAHEINNPLNFISINEHNQENDFKDFQELVGEYRSLIQKVGVIPDVAEEVMRLRERERELDIDYLLSNIPKTFEMTKNGVERITAITRSMRNYSFKNEKGNVLLFDINNAIQESLVIAKAEYRDVAAIVLHVEALTPVIGDPSMITQVLLNLIINSVHAIKSQNRSSPGTIEIKTWETSESIFCSVRDDGTGIPEEIKGRVFEPFFTTKEQGKGTGLGLSITYDIIVNKHHGNISAESLPEGGSVFTFSLPLNRIK